MRALVTGGAGFIGSHLVDALLERGDEVVVLDNLSTGRRENLASALSAGARLTEGDIRDADVVREAFATLRPELVFHLAAQMDVRVSVARPSYDAEVNVVGTLNLLEACREETPRFVFASSGGAVYGEGADRAELLPFEEEAECLPDAPYGQSKLAGEGYVAVFERLFGVPSVSLRLGNVYGPRQHPKGEAGVVAIFCGRLMSGERPTVFGDGRQTRDYIYVDDIVDSLIAAAGSEAGGVYNVGTGVESTVLDLVTGLAEIAEEPGFEPRFEPARLGEVQRTAIDCARAERSLGWKAQVDLEGGLRRTVEWVRASEPS